MYRQVCQYLKHYIKFQICHGKTENMAAHTHTHKLRENLKRSQIFKLKINVSNLLTIGKLSQMVINITINLRESLKTKL